MNKTIIIVLVICVVLFIAYLVSFSVIRNKITNKAFNTIKNKNTEELNKVLSSKSANFFLKPFELYRLRLIYAASKGNDKEIEKSYASFDQLRMNKSEKENIYSDAYFYFMSKQDNANAKKYYELLEQIGDYKNKFNIQCSYNTFIEHDYKYLEDAIIRYNSSSNTNKVSLASLISAMYANKGDAANSKKFDDIAKSGINKQYNNN